MASLNQPDSGAGVSVEAVLLRDGQLVTQRLLKAMGEDAEVPPRLRQAIEYSLLAGGKRLRPVLVIESARACGQDAAATSASTLAAAAAIELVHTFSLVHDDLPAMDDDDLRRGKPTSHKVFGEAMAILAGDAMLTMAFELIARDAEPALSPMLVRELSQAAGPAGMIGGQVLDMESEHLSLSLEALQRVHRMKTGAMLRAACRMGAIAAGASAAQLSALTDYARELGLAFQIIDDVLDETSTPEQLGKATNKDVRHGKNTYPALMGIEASRAAAAGHVQTALAAVEPFGAEGSTLQSLAQFIIERNR